MGLLDQVLGNVLGTQRTSAPPSGGMSPLVKALLLLLAAKAATSAGVGRSSGSAGSAPRGGAADPGPSSGTISSGILQGLPSLQSLVERFTHGGHGETVQSWIGPGENRPIAPNELGSVLGPDTLRELEQQTGLPRDQLLPQLSQVLPQVVDRLTPQGRMPTEQELQHW